MLLAQPKVSIVLPVYNEAEIIETVIRDFYEKVIKKYPNSELIVAEDGSTDNTKEILARLEKEMPMKLVMGKERKGYRRGVTDALLLATGDYVFFCDTDNTHDPADVFKLLDKMEGNDLVTGVKLERNDPAYRILFSRAYNLMIYFIFGIWLTDINAGFKMMRREVIQKAVVKNHSLKYGFSTEIVIRAKYAGCRIAGVPVSHFARETGFAGIFAARKMPEVVISQLKGLVSLRVEMWRNG